MMVSNQTDGRYNNAQAKGEDKQEGEFFYFDLSDEHHEKLLEKELKEGHENPLGPLEEVTKVEY
ncbi:hypothetical protein I532_17948 [Brevibacillus borstelensis AK1]|uniref:Uncharacterized protein n=1 Tax=Brevibacillus borstelensis AK1 TaxID=1300222 RepID=M8DWR9_9BACL|nr:hypothetical protein I532_17948 [Brevibacillus borstelensis AK1]